MGDASEERFLFSETQKVILDKCYEGKKILDIGGGGEGIIGKIYGSNVIAIDKLASELEETENAAIKLVMDAAEMHFLPGQFDVVTTFYSFMYMKKDIIKEVLSEVHKVLKSEGVVEIWDTNIPAYDGGVQDVFVARIEAQLPEETITTGYGTLMGKDRISLSELMSMLEEQGFMIIELDNSRQEYRIKARKD